MACVLKRVESSVYRPPQARRRRVRARIGDRRGIGAAPSRRRSRPTLVQEQCGPGEHGQIRLRIGRGRHTARQASLQRHGSNKSSCASLTLQTQACRPPPRHGRQLRSAATARAPLAMKWIGTPWDRARSRPCAFVERRSSRRGQPTSIARPEPTHVQSGPGGEGLNASQRLGTRGPGTQGMAGLRGRRRHQRERPRASAAALMISCLGAVIPLDARSQELNQWRTVVFASGVGRLRLRDNHHYDLQEHAGSIRQGKWRVRDGALCLLQRRPFVFEGERCLEFTRGPRGEFRVVQDQQKHFGPERRMEVMPR